MKMVLTRKNIFFVIIGLIAAHFLKNEIEKNAVKKYSASIKSQTNIDFEKKIDKIKLNVFELIEKFHYTYKSPKMSAKEIENYENIINNYIVKV